ncbi:MAG: hypothetical protein GU362_06070 [Thaumarchaeota archaeon]|jgi:hypothetical protein|nr:hypothetical protein [Nitrososphaerota archaeon]
MTQYEKILNKISPVFYKFVRYDDYFGKNLDSTLSYMDVNKLITYSTILSRNKVNYALVINKKPFNNTYYHDNVIKLGKSNAVPLYSGDGYFEFITSIILNKFSFEDEIISPYGTTAKELFIALVGKDTYETIRTNIK